MAPMGPVFGPVKGLILLVNSAKIQSSAYMDACSGRAEAAMEVLGHVFLHTYTHVCT